MNKKLLGVLGVAALLLAGNFAWQEVKEVDAASGTTIYFKPNSNWSQANAKFDAWTWGGSSADSWVDFTDSNGDGIYEALLATGRTGMKIVRRGPSQTSHSWDSGQKWNETGDLTIPTNGNNLWTQTSGTWDGTGSWSKYVFVAPEYALMGTMTDWTTGAKMAENNGVYTLTLEDVPTGEQQFKLKSGEIWYGHSNFTVKGITVKNNSDDNCVFTSEGGNYTFEYTTSTKTLNVTHVSYAELNTDLSVLLNKYYNDGVYTRTTKINADPAKIAADLAENHNGASYESLFHASATDLDRVTTFNGGSLTMTIPGNDTYKSTYGTNENGMPHYNSKDHLDYTVPGTSMEEYYTTLCDIKDSTSVKWTNTDGVWTCTDKAVIKQFLDFTAPCFLNYNDTIANYFSLVGVSVQEIEGTLILKLLTSGDEGKLIDDAADVLSVATITIA